MYSFGIAVFQLYLSLAGVFKPYFKEWNALRSKHLTTGSKYPVKPNQNRIWIHCASLGEFEQIRSVIEQLRAANSDLYLLLSFFSPSGYTAKQSYSMVNEVVYLPVDTYRNMSLFVDRFKPTIYIGVKYELWWNLFKVLKEHNIPKVLCAMNMKSNHYVFSSFGTYYKALLQVNTIFFCQSDAAAKVLTDNGLKSVEVGGDPRVDSVIARKDAQGKDILILKEWCKGHETIVYGSVYLEDMPIIIATIASYPDYKHIVVPHDVSVPNATQIRNQLKANFSQLITDPSFIITDKTVHLLAEVGWLFDLYRLADVVYIGGGFTKNIHNTLEPAVFGLPIAIGPKHKGFVEIDAFKSKKLIAVVNDKSDFIAFIKSFDLNKLEKISKGLNAYFETNKGASTKITDYVISLIEAKIN